MNDSGFQIILENEETRLFTMGDDFWFIVSLCHIKTSLSILNLIIYLISLDETLLTENIMRLTVLFFRYTTPRGRFCMKDLQ